MEIQKLTYNDLTRFAESTIAAAAKRAEEELADFNDGRRPRDQYRANVLKQRYMAIGVFFYWLFNIADRDGASDDITRLETLTFGITPEDLVLDRLTMKTLAIPDIPVLDQLTTEVKKGDTRRYPTMSAPQKAFVALAADRPDLLPSPNICTSLRMVGAQPGWLDHLLQRW